MAETNIEWADYTFNPWIGCEPVSPGCANCYAAAMNKRFGHDNFGKGKPRRHTSETNWKAPLKLNNQAERELNDWEALSDMRSEFPNVSWIPPAKLKVFCGSMCDVFDPDVPTEWRYDLFNLILATPNLDWLLLTKRIGNVKDMIEEILPKKTKVLPDDHPLAWPWPHVWLGITVCNQAEADCDIPKLLNTPAEKRFLSCEPLLSKIDLTSVKQTVDPGFFGDCLQWYHKGHYHELEKIHYPKLDWVICGGESGLNARSIHPDWVRSLRDQCAAAGVPFMFKQWGEWAPYIADGWHGLEPVGLQRIGKKAAGRLLDGKEHMEFPDVK